MIKQRKDGSYKLIWEGVEQVHWTTNDDDADEGYYNAKKYAKNFVKYYGKNSEVKAHKNCVTEDGATEACLFTISSIKYKGKSNTLICEIRPSNKEQAIKIAGIESTLPHENAVYITRRARWRPVWMPDGKRRHLEFANLSCADLSGANLSGANLSGANLSRVDLGGANLRDANLRDADLRRADLRRADLSGAVMTGVDLKRAAWFKTTCPDGSVNKGKRTCGGDQLIPLA